jgi:Na+-driven multidrug efflux pump
VTLVLQWRPEALVRIFTREPEASAVGVEFLRLISWNFVAQGIVFTCSGIFQGLGNTRPALLSTAFRIALFVPLLLVMSRQPGFALHQIWYLSGATIFAQAAFSYFLLRGQFKRRLTFAVAPG